MADRPGAASTGKLPDVPVLVLAGDRDVRTPSRDGVAAASGFRQGRVVVAPGVGHMAVSSSSCVNSGRSGGSSGHVAQARCDRVPLTIEPLAPIPRVSRNAKPIGAVRGLAGRTLAATISTLREAEASWLSIYPAGWVCRPRAWIAQRRRLRCLRLLRLQRRAGARDQRPTHVLDVEAGTLGPGQRTRDRLGRRQRRRERLPPDTEPPHLRDARRPKRLGSFLSSTVGPTSAATRAAWSTVHQYAEPIVQASSGSRCISAERGTRALTPPPSSRDIARY